MLVRSYSILGLSFQSTIFDYIFGPIRRLVGSFFLFPWVLFGSWCDTIKMFQRSVHSEADVTRLIIVTSVRSIYLSRLGWLVILSKWNLHLFLDPMLSRIIFFFISQWSQRNCDNLVTYGEKWCMIKLF